MRFTVDGLTDATVLRLPRLEPGATWIATLADSVFSPRLWDNEHPCLYTLRVELCQGDNIIETTERKIGFREIEVRGNQLLVNGKAVKLHGVCRHEAHPLSGRVMTPEQERRDIELYRAANCNFIRPRTIHRVRRCWTCATNWACLSRWRAPCAAIVVLVHGLQ